MNFISLHFYKTVTFILQFVIIENMSKVDFTIESYRNWIKGWIKTRGLTQKRFMEKFPTVATSYPVLMSILNKNRNPTLSTFFDLFGPMDLSDEEKFFMLLLKLETELDLYEQKDISVREYLRKMRLRLIPYLRGDYEFKLSIDPTTAAFYKAYQILNDHSYKEGINQALLNQLRLQAGRQRKMKDIKETREAMQNLTSSLKKSP